VKQFWIRDVLEKSVPVKPPLELRKEPIADAVEHPWEEILELPDDVIRAVSANKNIGDLFDDVGRSLLILGEPGSGKTITLLELARDLITRAEGYSEQPVPVVFHLSAWTGRGQPVFYWLLSELSNKYQIPKKEGRSWLEASRLVLLLDGLDEVKEDYQAECVEAINAFAEEFALPGLVVCSRLQEYTALPVRLKLNEAIRLQPLSSDQIDDYVARAGYKVAALQSVLQQDQILQEQAQSPLMLSIMSMAYSLVNQDLSTDAIEEDTTGTI